MDDPQSEKLNIRSTKVFKLKDKASRGGMMFDLKKTFGFTPARIIIQKVHGRNNEFTLSAVIEKDPLLEKFYRKPLRKGVNKNER
jgi:hypothetical protein